MAKKKEKVDHDKNEPWPLFLLKAFIALSTVLAIGMYGSDRYHIGIDDQVSKCLPPYTFFLIDRYDKDVKKWDLAAFHAERIQPMLESGRDEIKPLAPRYENGKILIKQIVGVEGDVVEVNHDHVLVNGKIVGNKLLLAKALNRDPLSFQKTITIPKGAFWFMGKTDNSFDSRYWGFVYEHQIIGRVKPIY